MSKGEGLLAFHNEEGFSPRDGEHDLPNAASLRLKHQPISGAMMRS
jgi:hypothetical protein